MLLYLLCFLSHTCTILLAISTIECHTLAYRKNCFFCYSNIGVFLFDFCHLVLNYLKSRLSPTRLKKLTWHIYIYIYTCCYSRFWEGHFSLHAVSQCLANLSTHFPLNLCQLPSSEGDEWVLSGCGFESHCALSHGLLC